MIITWQVCVETFPLVGEWFRIYSVQQVVVNGQPVGATVDFHDAVGATDPEDALDSKTPPI